jgi:Spy/CpxP family protein refolding chaperone
MSQAKHLVHAVLGAVSILAIGVVLGVLLDRVILHPVASAADSRSAALAFDATHRGLLQDLRTDLRLTEEQVDQVHEIMNRHQVAVNEAWSVVHARLEAAIDSVTAEIEAILEPGQREGFHDWLLERHGESAAHGAGVGH